MRVRPAAESDRDDCYAICVATAADGESASASHRYPDLLGDVYVGPYLALEPQHCFVLIDDKESVVGYVLGTPDTTAFAQRAEEQWWPSVRRQTAAMTAPTSADDALLRFVAVPTFGDQSLLQAFPAHGHIDLLPAAQGRGMGRVLMTTLDESLRNAGAPGIHLGVSATNTRALGFYARLGFAEVARDENTVFVGRNLLLLSDAETLQ